MKNSMHYMLLVMAALATTGLTGCQKEEYATVNHTHAVSATATKVYTFSVTYQGAGQQIAKSDLITRLVGSIDEEDAVLVYSQVSTAQNGSYYWTAQPFADEDGHYYWYMVSDGGGLYFYAKAKEGYTWTQSFTELIKIVVIPASIRATASKKSIDYNNLEEVAEAYHFSID